ncbi:MAG TPA: methyltransferase domain-containing protein [Gaiellaceae bacterium]|nr:methyltransferase domain-containing protein [Gaiellaceae bacterium]
MSAGRFESWHSQSYAEAWAGEDVLADLLALPRRISAALVADSGLEVKHVVDVGSGPGEYLSVFLAAFPAARGTWIDSSDAMERLAHDRLGDGVTYLQADAERLDVADLPPAEVVVTSRMLHHFPPESQQRFYRTALATLEPGGFLFNLDHFGAPDPWEQRYRRIREQFTGARSRELRPHRHDFPLSPVEAHLAWLEEAGFEPPDVPWRAFFTALLAARKPARPHPRARP